MQLLGVHGGEACFSGLQTRPPWSFFVWQSAEALYEPLDSTHTVVAQQPPQGVHCHVGVMDEYGDLSNEQMLF